MVPFAGMFMFFRSLRWKWSFVLLLLPLLVLKDLLVLSHPSLGAISVLLAIGAWTLWTMTQFREASTSTYLRWVFIISQLLMWMFLFDIKDWMRILIVISALVGVTILVRENLENLNQKYNLRVGLLIQLMLSLYLLQKLSIYWASI